MTTPPPILPSSSHPSSGSHYASVLTTSVDQTIAIAASIASLLHSSDIIALTGELGSGKTQFVRGLAKGLGIDPRSVSSPTFILMTEYNSIQTNATLPLVHIDAYRIHGLSDLESVGWTDQIIAESVTAIEWADRITSQLPPDRLDITLEHQQENNQRRLIITTRGSWKQRYNSIIEILRDYQGFNAAGPVINSYTDNQENAVSTPKNPQKQLDSNLLPCPTCGKPVPTDSPISPFCSKRCRLIDLGKWLDGSYFTSRSINPDTDLQ